MIDFLNNIKEELCGLGQQCSEFIGRLSVWP